MTVAPLELVLPVDHVDSLFVAIDLVRSGAAATRPDIQRLTGLGRSIVKQRVEQAIELGLLEDAELAPSTGGRAPRQLRFVDERASILVAVFGAHGLGLGLSNLSGQILTHHYLPWDVTAGPDPSMEVVVREFDKMLAVSPGELWGIVIGIPGPVEFDSGRPVAPPIMPGWSGFDIRGQLSKHFNAPIWVDNDANLMALGEAKLLGDDTANLLFVKVGTGIGAGLISRGRIHRGADGGAGDVGHIIVSENPQMVCRCGQVGCLEAVAGGWALARDGRADAEAGRSAFLADRMAVNGGQLRPFDVVQGALSGDRSSTALIAAAGRVVGENVASMVNFFNPAVVVIGGAVADAGDQFLAVVRQIVYRRAVPLVTRNLRIVSSSKPELVGVLGAAHLAIEQLFDRDSMRAWITSGSPLHDHDKLYALSA